MNTYDPSDYLVYVHMDQRLPAIENPWGTVPAAHRLPAGYANQAPLTRLRRAASPGQFVASTARVLGGRA